MVQGFQTSQNTHQQYHTCEAEIHCVLQFTMKLQDDVILQFTIKLLDDVFERKTLCWLSDINTLNSPM